MAIQRLMPGLFNLIDNGGSYGRHKLNGENYRIFGFLENEILVLLFDVYVWAWGETCNPILEIFGCLSW